MEQLMNINEYRANIIKAVYNILKEKGYEEENGEIFVEVDSSFSITQCIDYEDCDTINEPFIVAKMWASEKELTFEDYEYGAEIRSYDIGTDDLYKVFEKVANFDTICA